MISILILIKKPLWSFIKKMRGEGFEPSRLYALDPKSSIVFWNDLFKKPFDQT